ncbi:MAG: uncharacterized protein KVP18_000197 [Porospora cf. gigantea A]|nr:MAG: hypothetical protein KVP18_000197 [Porospora cf. gigantea A]
MLSRHYPAMKYLEQLRVFMGAKSTLFDRTEVAHALVYLLPPLEHSGVIRSKKVELVVDDFLNEIYALFVKEPSVQPAIAQALVPLLVDFALGQTTRPEAVFKSSLDKLLGGCFSNQAMATLGKSGKQVESQKITLVNSLNFVALLTLAARSRISGNVTAGGKLMKSPQWKTLLQRDWDEGGENRSIIKALEVIAELPDAPPLLETFVVLSLSDAEQSARESLVSQVASVINELFEDLKPDDRHKHVRGTLLLCKLLVGIKICPGVASEDRGVLVVKAIDALPDFRSVLSHHNAQNTGYFRHCAQVFLAVLTSVLNGVRGCSLLHYSPVVCKLQAGQVISLTLTDMASKYAGAISLALNQDVTADDLVRDAFQPPLVLGVKATLSLLNSFMSRAQGTSEKQKLFSRILPPLTCKLRASDLVPVTSAVLKKHDAKAQWLVICSMLRRFHGLSMKLCDVSKDRRITTQCGTVVDWIHDSQELRQHYLASHPLLDVSKVDFPDPSSLLAVLRKLPEGFESTCTLVHLGMRLMGVLSMTCVFSEFVIASGGAEDIEDVEDMVDPDMHRAFRQDKQSIQEVSWAEGRALLSGWGDAVIGTLGEFVGGCQGLRKPLEKLVRNPEDAAAAVEVQQFFENLTAVLPEMIRETWSLRHVALSPASRFALSRCKELFTGMLGLVGLAVSEEVVTQLVGATVGNASTPAEEAEEIEDAETDSEEQVSDSEDISPPSAKRQKLDDSSDSGDSDVELGGLGMLATLMDDDYAATLPGGGIAPMPKSLLATANRKPSQNFVEEHLMTFSVIKTLINSTSGLQLPAKQSVDHCLAFYSSSYTLLRASLDTALRNVNAKKGYEMSKDEQPRHRLIELISKNAEGTLRSVGVDGLSQLNAEDLTHWLAVVKSSVVETLQAVLELNVAKLNAAKKGVDSIFHVVGVHISASLVMELLLTQALGKRSQKLLNRCEKEAETAGEPSCGLATLDALANVHHKASTRFPFVNWCGLFRDPNLRCLVKVLDWTSPIRSAPRPSLQAMAANFRKDIPEDSLTTELLNSPIILGKINKFRKNNEQSDFSDASQIFYEQLLDMFKSRLPDLQCKPRQRFMATLKQQLGLSEGKRRRRKF